MTSYTQENRASFAKSHPEFSKLKWEAEKLAYVKKWCPPDLLEETLASIESGETDVDEAARACMGYEGDHMKKPVERKPNMTTETKILPIDLIKHDGGTQMRADLDIDVCNDYRDKIVDGVEFPPLDVFHDGSNYWLADGFHRFYGYRHAKKASVKCTVHSGTVRDAILFAVGANATHGLPRSNKDKRNSVLALLNDPEWVKWSDRKIADQAGVGHPLVSECRKQLEDSSSSPAAAAKDQPKIGKDGKTRKSPRKARAANKQTRLQVVQQQLRDIKERDKAADEELANQVAGMLNQSVAALNANATNKSEDSGALRMMMCGKPNLMAALKEHLRWAVKLADELNKKTDRKFSQHQDLLNTLEIAGKYADEWERASLVKRVA